MRRHIWHMALCPTLLLLGCATMAPTLPPGPLAAQGEQARSYRQIMELSGRLSVHYQLNDKDEALHGNFTWLQNSDQTLLALLSPLGQTIAEIRITPAASILNQAGKPPKSASDPDTLAADALGWPLPLKGMREWLQGFAISGDGSRFVANPQSDHVSTSDGWRIRYVTWQDDPTSPGLRFPKRIDLERSTSQAGEVGIRIVIDAIGAR